MASFYSNLSLKAFIDVQALGLFGLSASASIEATGAAGAGVPLSYLSTIMTNPSGHPLDATTIWNAGLALSKSPLFTLSLPPTLTDAEFLNQVNINLTGDRIILPAELAAFQGLLDQGLTRAEVADYMSSTIASVNASSLNLSTTPNQSNPGGLSDYQTFANQQLALWNRGIVSDAYANASVTASNFNYTITSTPLYPGVIGAENSVCGVTQLNSTLTFALGQVNAAAALNNPSLIQCQYGPDGTYNFTLNIETINVTNTGDAVVLNGIQAPTGSTYQTGDVVNGNGQTYIPLTLAGNPNNGTTGSSVVINSVDAIEVTLNANSNLNASNFTSVNYLYLLKAASGTQLTVDTAKLNTTYGFSTTSDAIFKIASYANASGANDILKLQADNAGSLNKPAVFDVGGGGVIEAVNLLTYGTNYLTLHAGPNATKIVLDGFGNNNATIVSSGNKLALFDASTLDGNLNVVFNIGTSSGLATSATINGGKQTNNFNFNETSGIGDIVVNASGTGSQTITAATTLFDDQFSINGGNGNFTIENTSGGALTNGSSIVILGDGSNKITLGNGGNEIIAGNGQNSIISGSGADAISVGNGINTFTMEKDRCSRKKAFATP